MRPVSMKPVPDVFSTSADFEKAIATQGEAAAHKHLAEGRPVYYAKPEYPGFLVKKNPDGSEQLVRVDSHGNISVVRGL